MKRILSLSAAVLFLGTALASCQKKGGPVSVDRVDPDQGINAGGDHVVIRGSGFEPGKTQVEVWFGRRKAEQVSISSAGKLNVVTPPGDKGPVDVRLMFDNGEAHKITNGFRYVDQGASGDMRKAFFSKQAPAGAPPAQK